MSNYVKLDDLPVYKIASNLSDYVWDIVVKWNWFSQKTIGSQWVASTDSIATNIAEGFGRFFKKDKQKFYYYARGSVFESAHQTKKSYQRKLITKEEYEFIISELRKLPIEINKQIRYLEKKLKK